MTKKLFPNPAEKVKTGFWSLNQDKLARVFFYLLILFLPTQLGKHFWPEFSFVYGIRLDYLSPTLYFTDLILIFLIIASFKNTLKILTRVKRKYLKLFALYTAFLFLTTFLVKNPNALFYGIIKFLELSYLFIYIYFNAKKFNNEVIFNLLFLGLFFEFLLSFFQVLNNGSLGGIFYFLGERSFTSQTPGIANASINGSLYLRPYATFSHPNVLAFYLMSATLLVLNFFKQKTYQKYLLLFSIIISTVGICLTLGRVAIFVWLLNLIIIFYWQVLKKIKNKKRIILLFILFVFIIFLPKNIYTERILSISPAEEAYTQRAWLTNQALDIFKNHTLFGVGINNFYYYLSPYFSGSKNLLIQPVHNIYLLILTETGIVGFLFFAFLILQIFKNFNKNLKKRKYLFHIFVSMLIMGFFDHYLLTLQQGQLLFVLILGLSAYKQ